jgi:hypothetical protein
MWTRYACLCKMVKMRDDASSCSALVESAVMVTKRSQVRILLTLPRVVVRAICAILVDGGWVWLAPFAEYHMVG